MTQGQTATRSASTLASIGPTDGITLRAATPADAESVAEIWHAGWKEAHLGNVPDELVAARTVKSFHAWARERVPDTTVAVVCGEIAGFVMIDGDEVDVCHRPGDACGHSAPDDVEDCGRDGFNSFALIGDQPRPDAEDLRLPGYPTPARLASRPRHRIAVSVTQRHRWVRTAVTVRHVRIVFTPVR